ncbi:hypothetical protein U728_760 [Clostridium botulinum 202F]|nr:hypothetical protein U728_760 [Clostridium botulinum 202F]MBY6988460.1 hypothetical protein [Clostridium botulinum]
MKRYFDIPNQKLTLQIDVDKAGMKYSVEQIEKALNLQGLKEVNLKEYNKLSKLYCA